MCQFHNGPDGWKLQIKKRWFIFLKMVLNYKLNEIELMQKNWKELEHVLFLFKENDVVCSRWKKRMEATAAFQKKCIYKSMQNTSPNT